MAIGLPIKMVVLTIVGMAGLAAMLIFVNNSANIIPQPMYANVKNNTLIILSASPDTIELQIEVINSEDGTPVERASVVMSGLNAAAVNLTGSNGETILTRIPYLSITS